MALAIEEKSADLRSVLINNVLQIQKELALDKLLIPDIY